jgi:hypothetical protein
LDERRARRALWAFRLIFYPAAALCAWLLLAGNSDAKGPLIGRTQQGHEFVIQLDGDRPLWFETAITETCGSGHEFTRTWATSQPFHARGGVLEFEDTSRSRWSNGQYGTRSVRLRARVDHDGVTGTLWLTDRLGPYDCASGAVSFSARAG